MRRERFDAKLDSHVNHAQSFNFLMQFSLVGNEIVMIIINPKNFP